MNAKKRLRLGFVYNVRHTKPGLEKEAQDEAEFDEPETIRAIHEAIVANGYIVIDIEANDEAFEALKKQKRTLDLVFNIAEGKYGDAREAQVPAMLDFLEIPYTHSSTLTHAISLNKQLTKLVWQRAGVPTPKSLFLSQGQHMSGDISFPVVVKPNAEGSSKGIFNTSVAKNNTELSRAIKSIRSLMGGDILIEEFIGGREFTITVMGNEGVGDGVYVLPFVEQNFDIFPPDLEKLASYEAKWFFEDHLPNPHDAYHCPPKLPKRLHKEIEELCIRAYTALKCRDVARIDLRLDEDEERPYFLEINTLPGMIADPTAVSYFPVAARAHGWNYTQMVGAVIDHAKERLGI